MGLISDEKILGLLLSLLKIIGGVTPVILNKLDVASLILLIQRRPRIMI